MPNYATLAQAETFFATILYCDDWTNATEVDKEKALTMATRAIDGLNFQGEKTDEIQENQFPRGDDLVVPNDIVRATCELALVLLGGADDQDAAEASGILSEAYASVKTQYSPSAYKEWEAAGIMSVRAWRLLKPYLIDPRFAEVTRI